MFYDKGLPFFVAMHMTKRSEVPFYVAEMLLFTVLVTSNVEVTGMRNLKNCLQKMKQPYYNKFVHKICGINVRGFKSHKESEYLLILTISKEKYKN